MDTERVVQLTERLRCVSRCCADEAAGIAHPLANRPTCRCDPGILALLLPPLRSEAWLAMRRPRAAGLGSRRLSAAATPPPCCLCAGTISGTCAETWRMSMAMRLLSAEE